MKGQLSRNKVVEQAVRISNEQGYDQLTIAKLASDFGIKSPSLYNHVANLTELRQILAVKGLEEIYDAVIHEAMAEVGDAAILKIAQAYVAYALKNPGLYDALSKVPEPTAPDYHEASEKLVGLMLKYFSAYALDKDDAIHAVRGFRSFLHGFVLIQKEGGFRLSQDLHETLAFFVRTYVNGLQKG